MKPPRSPPRCDPETLEKSALHYLERFAASRQLVVRVLMRRVERAVRAGGPIVRAEGAALVEAVVERLAARGLLDDRRFAEGRVRSLVARGRSSATIRNTLREKGVEREDVDRAMERLAEDLPQLDMAAAINLARRRKLGPHRSAGERAARRAKDFGVLARAGFSRSIAVRILDADSVAALEALRDEIA